MLAPGPRLMFPVFFIFIVHSSDYINYPCSASFAFFSRSFTYNVLVSVYIRCPLASSVPPLFFYLYYTLVGLHIVCSFLGLRFLFFVYTSHIRWNHLPSSFVFLCSFSHIHHKQSEYISYSISASVFPTYTQYTQSLAHPLSSHTLHNIFIYVSQCCLRNAFLSQECTISSMPPTAVVSPLTLRFFVYRGVSTPTLLYIEGRDG